VYSEHSFQSLLSMFFAAIALILTSHSVSFFHIFIILILILLLILLHVTRILL